MKELIKKLGFILIFIVLVFAAILMCIEFSKVGGLSNEELQKSIENLGKKDIRLLPLNWPLDVKNLKELSGEQQNFIQDKSLVNNLLEWAESGKYDVIIFTTLIGKYRSDIRASYGEITISREYFNNDPGEINHPYMSLEDEIDNIKKTTDEKIGDDKDNVRMVQIYKELERKNIENSEKYWNLRKKYEEYKQLLLKRVDDEIDIYNKIYELDDKLYLSDDVKSVYEKARLLNEQRELYKKLIDIENKYFEYKKNMLLPLMQQVSNNNLLSVIRNRTQEEQSLLSMYPNGIAIQTLRVIKSFKNADHIAHAESLIINYDTKEILLIDPHTPPNGEFVLNVQKFINKLKFDSIFSDFTFNTLEKYISKIGCRIFQGVFIEKSGMCVLWNLYMVVLFAINDSKNYNKIIEIHKNNTQLTKRRIESFAFELYSTFKDSINNYKDQLVGTYNESFSGPVNILAKESDCTAEYPHYSSLTKKCYSTLAEKNFNELEYKKHRCDMHGDVYDENTERCVPRY